MEIDATKTLNSINQLANKMPNKKPWPLTFCYGMALQSSAIEIWQGYSENVGAAQRCFLIRAQVNLNKKLIFL